MFIVPPQDHTAVTQVCVCGMRVFVCVHVSVRVCLFDCVLVRLLVVIININGNNFCTATLPVLTVKVGAHYDE